MKRYSYLVYRTRQEKAARMFTNLSQKDAYIRAVLELSIQNVAESRVLASSSGEDVDVRQKISINVSEHFYLKNGKVVYFLDEKTVKMLEKATFSGQDLSKPWVHDHFSVALPSNLETPPLLVGRLNNEKFETFFEETTVPKFRLPETDMCNIAYASTKSKGYVENYSQLLSSFGDEISTPPEIFKLEGAQVMRKAIEIALRLVAFLQCFPEVLKPGFPQHSIVANENTKFNKMRSFNVSLPENIRNSPSPHIRGAHTRTLRSPRFTHKMGQTIEIPATLVGGGHIDPYHVN